MTCRGSRPVPELSANPKAYKSLGDLVASDPQLVLSIVRRVQVLGGSLPLLIEKKIFKTVSNSWESMDSMIGGV